MKSTSVTGSVGVASIPGSDPYVCMMPVARPKSSVPRRRRLVKRFFFGPSGLIAASLGLDKEVPIRCIASRNARDKRGKTSIRSSASGGRASEPKRKQTAAPSADPIRAQGTDCSISKPPSARPQAANTMPHGAPTSRPSRARSVPSWVPSSCSASEPATMSSELTMTTGAEVRRARAEFGAKAQATSVQTMNSRGNRSSPRSSSRFPREKEQLDPI